MSVSVSKEERLLEWLRDAHAMEVQVEKVLKGQANRLIHYPQLRARVEQHIEETRAQTGLLEGCIERHGGTPSVAKDFSSKVVGIGQSVGSLVAGDAVVKGVLNIYTLVHMGIASYKILVATAEEIGDLQTVEVCKRILIDEETMARWLDDHLAQITQQYLSRESNPELQAKR